MDTAIRGRVALSPNHVLHPVPGDKYPLHKQNTKWSTVTSMSAPRLGKGGGLLEKPIIEKTTPGRESEFDLSFKLYKDASVDHQLGYMN